MLKILPQLFYQTPEIRKILVDGLSCIVHKKLEEPVLHKEGYVSTHAITLVLQGLLKIENDNNLLATIRENQMVFLPKGLYTISDILPREGVFEAVVFFFEESLISEFLGSINLKTNKERCVTHIVMDYTPEIKLFTESTLQVYGNKSLAHRSLTRVKLFELLHLLSNTQTSVCLPGALTTLNNKEKKSLREFMNTNFSKPLAIEDYAYLTGRSISTFRRDFMVQFGVSPKQWLIDKRLDKAKLLLTNGDTSVSQVAVETGYENVSHFVKAFHKRFGTPPKQFLMKQRKEVLV